MKGIIDATDAEKREAPNGMVWVCTACGKRSHDAYGIRTISRGWDESCFLNCVLVEQEKVVLQNERVVRILEEP